MLHVLVGRAAKEEIVSILTDALEVVEPAKSKKKRRAENANIVVVRPEEPASPKPAP